MTILLVLFAFISVSNAITFSNISTTTGPDQSRNHTVTVFSVSNNTILQWILDSTYVANATYVVVNGSLDGTALVLNDSNYDVDFESDGLTVTTVLMLKPGYFKSNYTVALSNGNQTVSETFMPPVAVTIATTTPSVSSTTTQQMSENSTMAATVTTTPTEATVPPDVSTATTENPKNMNSTANPTANSTVVPPELIINLTSSEGCDLARQECNFTANLNCSRGVVGETCMAKFQCVDGIYVLSNIKCNGQRACMSPGVWGANCGKLCGGGCDTLGNSSVNLCDASSGKCISNSTGQIVDKCLPGWNGDRCQQPICNQNCHGGTCLAPNYCGNCPRHYESGPTCRNVSLYGFVEGSLPTLGILGGVVIILKIASDIYENRKSKTD